MLTIGTLANIKHILQKEHFNSNDEKVLSVCTVTKTLKKKKPSYLCIASTPPPHTVISICQLKQYERDSEYKRKRNWAIDELKYLDGKSESSDTHEFDIMLDKLYKWYAISLHERQNFIVVLHKQVQKHVKGPKVVFRNVPTAWLMDKSPEKAVGKVAEQTAENSDDDYEDSQTLTEKELANLNALMADSDLVVKDAEKFMEQLNKQLQELDGANVESVLTSEHQVRDIMEQIEEAINQAEKIESQLDSYDEILGHVRETMEKMGGKNQMIEIVNNNHIKLMYELDKLITQLDLPYEHQLALSEPDLKTQGGREAAIAAGKSLQRCMNADIDPPLLRMQAVQDQRKRFEKWKAKFSLTISRYLNNLFIHLGNDMAENVPLSTDLTLPKHTGVHKELVAYTELMHWTKAMDRKTYDGLAKVYTSSLCKIYDRDIRNFFSQARIMITSKFRGSREDLNSSGAKAKQSANVPYGMLGVNKETWSSGVEPSERAKFDAVLEKVLGELEPIALAEQTFCIQFFQLDVLSPTTKNTQTTLDALEQEPQKSEADNVIFPQKKIDRQINEEVRKMMLSLFGCLEPELNSFIQSFEKLDSFYSLYVLVRLTQHVMSAEDTHSFLSMTFASALVHVKRSFDKFMQQQLQSIKDSKVPKRSKCGILAYVENFEEFASTAEEIFKKSERRADIDKWYIQLVNTIFEYIPMHATEHQKTPSDVVRMENYHHMYSLLAQIKVPALDPLKKDAKQRYTDALKHYVIKYFGRPLEKLNLFFEGVQQKVSQGVKETEISYQMAYSKQELRKVISQYPAREVKKGLENLYKKVEKHLCEEENLLQVVWHAMQEEFIAQYNFLEERIQKCYAGAMITLEFTIHDILTFFSDIARSH